MELRLTNKQRDALKDLGHCSHTRVFGGFTIVFEIDLDDERKPFISSTHVDTSRNLIITFDGSAESGNVIPMPRAKK